MSPGRLARKAAWVLVGLSIPLLVGRFVFSLVLPVFLPATPGTLLATSSAQSATTSRPRSSFPGGRPSTTRVGLHRETVEYHIDGRRYTLVERHFRLGGSPTYPSPMREAEWARRMMHDTPGATRRVHYLPIHPSLALTRQPARWFELAIAVFVLLPIWLLLIPPRLWVRLLAWHQVRRARL